ncbi:VlmB-like protein [Micromonospora maritima]|uniref:VlmB-like protein n=1 Tax=Micromonospora maritima TaxID=986711 RepID=A0ABW7ZGY0_9ACTN
MTSTIPTEADWDAAPGLLDGAMNLELTAERCDLAYWLESVAQGTLRDRAATGHSAAAGTPAHMREPGPLRETLTIELGYRSVAEEKATRILAHYVANAPGLAELEFYTTQLVDEARHAMVFRRHLVELGESPTDLGRTIAELSADYTREVLDPIEQFALRTVRDDGDFIGGVAIFTIVIEGVLAPAAELSERKWEPLDPAASEIARGATIDEIRHLTVGSSLIREHLIRHPEYRPRLLEVLRAGRRLWDELPDRKYVLHREELFQEGMRQHADIVGDYEIWPGRLMRDTTPDERYDTAEKWTDEMAVARMKYMGLEDALPIVLQRPTA